MMDRETAHQLRGMVSRGVLRAANDGGEVQTADVSVWQGVVRTDVEVMQPFGFASVAPPGGTVILLAVGADQGDVVAIPVGSPAFRLGNLSVGDTAVYGLDGSRMVMSADGRIAVTATASVTIKTPSFEAELSGDLWRLKRTDGSEARIVADADHLKMRRKDEWIVISDAGLIVSRPPVVGPDPHPDK